MISQLSKSIRQYMLVTFNYWNFTVTDGALRMLVVLYFHDLGYSTLAIASLFLFYEFFWRGDQSDWWLVRGPVRPEQNHEYWPSDASVCVVNVGSAQRLADDSLGDGCASFVWYR